MNEQLKTENGGAKIVAVYGSPRRKGNTALLLNKAVEGALEAGAVVEKIVLRDYKMSPCLEIYGCKKNGQCVIQDDYHVIMEKILGAEGLLLASPIFFYAVSSHTKMLMERCQSLWVKKYWIDGVKPGEWKPIRKGVFICVGATQGKKLFEGAVLSVRYFFDVLDMELTQTLLYRGLDFEGDVSAHPEYLDEAYGAGKNLALSLQKNG